MHNEDLKNLSRARIIHSQDCLREANLLNEAHEWKGTANRAYCAAFHAMRAVLILDGFDSKKHSGIIAKFRENYLKTDLFNKEISDSISSLFRVRSASDYDDFYIVSKDEAERQLKNASMIVETIKQYLSKNNIV
ncbi:MAG: HEPN domain-containing protein [Clostridiales bacterium]|nr:HEPN domain-containing protein [Clostridiales bacterium]